MLGCHAISDVYQRVRFLRGLGGNDGVYVAHRFQVRANSGPYDLFHRTARRIRTVRQRVVSHVQTNSDHPPVWISGCTCNSAALGRLIQGR